MRVFWWQQGLHIEPENQQEASMLVALVDGLKFGRAELPSEQLAESGVGNAQLVPSAMPSAEVNGQETVRRFVNIPE